MSTTIKQQSALVERRQVPDRMSAYELFSWEQRHAVIPDPAGGEDIFRQEDVEFPVGWSQGAVNIVSQKYFRGNLGTPQRESSLRDVVDRVVDTITQEGQAAGHFADGEAEVFREEMKYALCAQQVSFNSPVWFNIGVPDTKAQAAACFILSVDDTMDSILTWYQEEGVIFKGGSGSGVNLSRIRASDEKLSHGGTASGPVSFMRGADASAGAIKSGGATRRAAKMVVLDVDHPDIEAFIDLKAHAERVAATLQAGGFDVTLGGGDEQWLFFQNANNSVRVTDEFMEAVLVDGDWELTARTTGEVVKTVKARDLWNQIAQAAWECADPGVQFDTTINGWNTTPVSGRINASNPCSEHVRLDNSSCNLASVNLLAFLADDGSFDVEGFTALCRLTFLAQDILVGFADYPTEAIAKVTIDFRDLGLGYTNLGALLMSMGLPYDSGAGRAMAAAITSLLTGSAYARSVEMAQRVGPFARFDQNRDAALAVMARHAEAAVTLPLGERPLSAADVTDDMSASTAQAFEDVRTAQVAVWEEVRTGAAAHGLRNAQASVLAPTGTISFMLDADTTGVEPDFALVKSKVLVGGGSMQIVNRSVRRALGKLGYDNAAIDRIEAHVAETGSIAGAPGFRPEHQAVFATAVGAGSIEPMGHVRMLGAVQPHLAGAVSKTVNLPHEATVEDVADTYLEAWKLGVKCIALYRDGCKVSQPLSAASNTEETEAPPLREREELPRTRNSKTFAFEVAGCKGYATVGEYDDGRPGELFLKVAKQGSTLAGITDAFAIAVSHGLQYGVPLSSYVKAFTGMRFEPMGMTDDEEIRLVASLADYTFRKLAVVYLDEEERRDLGILTTQERVQPELIGLEGAGVENAPSHEIDSTGTRPRPNGHGDGQRPDVANAPLCTTCGGAMVRSGTCYVCPADGTTSGCS